LKLYAQRRMAKGFAFSRDGNWQREFEDAFEYTPTKDQLNAMVQIKGDMEHEQPMDRLLCGDVGFGKTEVAMRAAFKALGDGKQVAVLAPTTVLAFQHFETFKRRFQPFPVRIEMFSRFRDAKEIKAGLTELAEGKVDVAIGKRVARELHLSPNPGIVTSHWMYLKLELTQLKLSKDIRLKKLLTRGKWMIVSALTAPELTLLKRGQLIGWTIGTVLLPRCFAQPIMKAAFELTPAAWLPRALRRL
jgi:hypothetical protein